LKGVDDYSLSDVSGRNFEGYSIPRRSYYSAMQGEIKAGCAESIKLLQITKIKSKKIISFCSEVRGMYCTLQDRFERKRAPEPSSYQVRPRP
jgi:hypothetical protein